MTGLIETLRRSVDARVSDGAQAESMGRGALWNATAVVSPAAVVECRVRADVQAAVTVAAEYDLPVSILSGGHDWAGRAICPGGVVLDLRGLAGVAWNRDGTGITVGGGITTRDLLASLPDDRAVVTGAWSSTGVVGVATGGGYGKLNRRFGLAADSILRAELVLAEGSVAIAGPEDDAELLWALRGGGCNVGVVTSMTFVAHPLPTVLTGTVFVPLDKAKAALLEVQAMLDAADDGLSIHTALVTMPSVGPGLLLGPLWIGEAAEGERRLGRIARLDGAQSLAQRWSPYRETVDPGGEVAWPKGGDYRMDAHTVPRFDETVADILVEAAHRFASEQDALIMHDLCGAAARVPRDATAFAMREPHINVQVLAGRDAGRDGDGRARANWLADVRSAFSPWGARGGYPNLLGPDAQADARRFYGEAASRLDRAKAAYDPAGRFPSNTGRLTEPRHGPVMPAPS